MNPNDTDIDPVVMALESYLENFEPAQDGMDMLLRTTEAIERELSDMVDPVPGDVARLMVQAGYRIVYRPDGRHGWAMRARRE